MKRIWLKQYPKGVPHDISIPHSSIPEEFKKCIQKFSNHKAFENFGQTMSFKQWDQLSDDFASFLQNHCGLKKESV